MNSTLPLKELLSQKKLIVCCGAGGVGKTTVSAALAFSAAKQGRKTLVLTIDPSKRLAETLGVEQNPKNPVEVPADRRQKAGIGPGMLDAWMLNPKQIADEAVRKILRSQVDGERKAESLLKNRLYTELSSLVAGMQEYTAMKALHRFLTESHYELIILDTPPSRHALDFLEAPTRVAQFLEGRIFQLFLPSIQKQGPAGFLRRAASSAVHRVFSAVFGEDFAADLTDFFGSFSEIFSSLNRDLSEMQGILRSPQSAFLLVSAPTQASVDEALHFYQKTIEKSLPFSGFVFNGSYGASLPDRFHQTQASTPNSDWETIFQSFGESKEKWSTLVERERQFMVDEETLLRKITQIKNQFCLRLPKLIPDQEGIQMLKILAQVWEGESPTPGAQMLGGSGP